VILVVAGAVWAGCGNRAAGPPVDDATITNEVKAKLHAQFGPIEHREARQMERGADQEVPAYIDVSSSNGMVTLTGEVHGNKAKAKAEEIAKGSIAKSGGTRFGRVESPCQSPRRTLSKDAITPAK